MKSLTPADICNLPLRELWRKPAALLDARVSMARAFYERDLRIVPWGKLGNDARLEGQGKIPPVVLNGVEFC